MKTDILKIGENFEVWIGDCLIHTAGSLESAQNWVEEAEGMEIHAHNKNEWVIVE
jgi:hypothetical protein